jgi:prepilin-type N-terminal cleavage/methylation domain-containing protein
MRYIKDIRGMTLLEVAIALFVLAIGLLGLAGLQLVVLQSDSLGHEATLATTLAKAKLAELEKTPALTQGADHYVDKANGKTYTREWAVQPDVPYGSMSTMIVRVSWKDTLADRCVTVRAVASQT